MMPPCPGINPSYTARLANGQPLPSTILFKEASSQLEIIDDGSLEAGNLIVTVTGALASPALSDSMTITITVKNPVPGDAS
jgi:hypothetical protein